MAQQLPDPFPSSTSLRSERAAGNSTFPEFTPGQELERKKILDPGTIFQKRLQLLPFFPEFQMPLR